MQQYRGTFFIIFLVLLFIPCSAFSQVEESASMDHFGVYTLGEIVVTGEREGVETATTVRRVTAEEIRDKGARDLTEAISLLPGVYIRVGAEGTPRVDIRGLRSRHVILLLDGIPLNSTNDGQFDPSLIPVENIAEIKVSYSDHSVLYGDGGLAGVINIITKKGTEGIHGMASVEGGGPGDQYLERFSASGGQEKWNLFVSGSIFDRHASPLSDDFEDTPVQEGNLRENSDFERDNVFGNFTYSPNEEWEFGVTLNYLEGEFGKPPSVIDDAADPFASRARYERVDDMDGISGQFAVRYSPGPLSVRSWIFFNQLEQETNRYDNSNYDTITLRNSFHINEETTVSGISVQPKYDLGRAGQITLALNARTEEFDTDGFTVERVGGVDTPVSFDEDHENDIYSVAIEYEVWPVERLGVVLGYNYNWLDKEEGDDDDEGAFLAAAYYDFPTGTRVRGAVSKQVRFPSIRQLYGIDEGNPDLTTEESMNYEAGIEQRLPWNTWASFTAFYLDVEDFIEKPPGEDIFENNDKYKFTGFEVVAENRTFENLLVRAGYTFMDSDNESPGTEVDELQYRPKHKVTLEGVYNFAFGLRAYFSMLYVADQVFYSRNEPIIKKELNDYIVFNVKVEQALFDNLLHLYVGADNLFDENYETSYGFPQPGRFIYAGGRVIF